MYIESVCFRSLCEWIVVFELVCSRITSTCKGIAQRIDKGAYKIQVQIKHSAIF